MPDRGYVHAVVGRLGEGERDREPFATSVDVVATPVSVVWSSWGHASLVEPRLPVGLADIHRVGLELHAVGEIWLDTPAGFATWVTLQRWATAKFSVGFLVQRSRPATAAEAERGIKRWLERVELLECSLTAIPAMPRTYTVLVAPTREEVQASLEVHMTVAEVRQRELRAAAEGYQRRRHFAA